MNQYPRQPEFGQYLKQERIARHLSQAEFAKKIDASVQEVQRWEKGKHFPRPSYLRAIVTFLQETSQLSPIPAKTVYEAPVSTHEDVIYIGDMDDSRTEERNHRKSIGLLIAALVVIAIVIATIILLFAHP